MVSVKATSQPPPPPQQQQQQQCTTAVHVLDWGHAGHEERLKEVAIRRYLTGNASVDAFFLERALAGAATSASPRLVPTA
jgi:hypothetical protein